MNLRTLCERLESIEKRMLKGVRDNLKIQMLRLVLFADGSGEIQADWSNYREDMCKEERLLNAIFTRDGPIFTFDRVEDLERWLEEKEGNE
jgi:hypothetical protein